MNNKIIFHLDLNCFFCRCEEIINPKLEKIPFIVGSAVKRSVVSASNKIARQYGVKAATKYKDAIRMCPQLISVEPHMQLYQSKSQEFFNCIRQYFSNEIEIMSIDECFLDATNLLHQYHDNYEILALEIIKKVKAVTNLYVTIGVGDNKFLAKMAGDTKPESGCATIFKDEIREKLWPLAIDKVFMVGKVTCEILHSLGILKVIDFVNYKNHSELLHVLKTKRYNTLMEYCFGGIDEPINCESWISKSISSSSTFSTDTNDSDKIRKRLNWLIDNVYQDMISGQLLTMTLSVTIKYDFTNHVSKSFTRKQYTNDHVEIKATLIQLFNDLWNEDQEIRGLSVSLSKLILQTDLMHQINLDF